MPVSCISLTDESLVTDIVLFEYSNPTGRLELNRKVLHRLIKDVLLSPAPIVENAELHELANAFLKS